MSEMSISMCERLGVPSVSTMWRAVGRVLDPVATAPAASPAAHAVEQLLRAALLERHHARAHGLDTVGVAVDPDRGETAVGEAQRERQPDAAEADDGDVVLEGVVSAIALTDVSV